MKLLCYQAATLQHRKGKALKNKMQEEFCGATKKIWYDDFSIIHLCPQITEK